MNVKIVIAFFVVALAAFVKADFDDDDLVSALIAANIIGNSQQCAAYGTACGANRPCCQYVGYVQMDCFNNQCLQSVCGYSGQQCGPFVGDCCYHLNLQCVGSGFVGQCVAKTQA